MTVKELYLIKGFNYSIELNTEDLSLISTIQDWCQDKFGNNWALSYPNTGYACPVWYFVNGEDATMFTLKWL